MNFCCKEYIIIFSVFNFIHPYGCCIALGIILALLLSFLTIKKQNILLIFNNILIYIYFFSFFFGKIFFIIEFLGISFFINQNYFLPSIFSIIRGGFCILGASFGGVLGMFHAIKKYNYKKFDFRILPISILLIHIFGRIGCYYGHCCSGKVYFFSLYPIVIFYYFVLFFIGLMIYYRTQYWNLGSTTIYYGCSVFFERFVFDFFRDDVIFIYYPLTYYHIASICYIILIFLIVKKYSNK